MRVSLYARVSTDEQAKEGYSLNAQVEKMRAFCFSQGWTIYKEYVEEGRSAKDIDRPQLQSLLANMNSFDVVLVYKLDRLSRNVSDINILLNTFEKNNVAFKSVTEPYDTTTAQGKLLINIFASLAQFEREQLAERVFMGMNRKHEEGERNGGRPPYGYDYLEGELIVNEEEAKWVRKMFDEAELKGAYTITGILNQNRVRTKGNTLWNTTMVSYVLSNPLYYGMTRWNYKKKGKRTYDEILVPGKHEPIITKEQFDKVSAIRKKRSVTKTKGQSIYPFSSILKCNRCGRYLYGAMRKQTGGKIYRFYKCGGRSLKGVCDMPIIGENTVDEEFIKNLDLAQVEVQMPEQETVDIKRIEKELRKTKERIERLEELYIDGDIPKKKYRERLEIEQKKETELSQSLTTQNNTMTPDRLIELIHSLKVNWSEISLEKRKRYLHRIFEYIEIECKSSGKKNTGAVIEITDYALN